MISHAKEYPIQIIEHIWRYLFFHAFHWGKECKSVLWERFIPLWATPKQIYWFIEVLVVCIFYFRLCLWTERWLGRSLAHIEKAHILTVFFTLFFSIWKSTDHRNPRLSHGAHCLEYPDTEIFRIWLDRVLNNQL